MRTVTRAYAAQASDPAMPEHWSGPPEIVDRVARLLGTAARVVDVATGVGGPARRLARVTGCEVVGVDLVPEVLGRARERAHREGLSRVRVVAGDAAALPLRSAVADQLWCLGAVAHVADLDAFCREVARVLRRSGSVAITEAFATGRRPPRFARTAPRPWHAVHVDDAMAALRRAGLVAVRRLSWPAALEDSQPSDPALAADLRDGALQPALVTARRP